MYLSRSLWALTINTSRLAIGTKKTEAFFRPGYFKSVLFRLVAEAILQLADRKAYRVQKSADAFTGNGIYTG